MTGTGEPPTLTAVVAERCPTCGRRAVTGGRCAACLTEIPLPRMDAGIAAAPIPLELVVSQGGAIAPQPVGGSQLVKSSTSRAIKPLPTPVPRKAANRLFGSAEIGGRVIAVRQGPHEPMDFDPWRWVAIPIWGLLLLISPLVAAIVIWQSAGFLPALGVAAISLLVLRYMFSDRLLQSWYMVAALNGRYVVEPMPVAMIRLRQANESEVQLRLKGQLSGGAVMEGDRIRAIGTWRWGVFRVRRIFCDRTGATIVPRQPNAFRLAAIGLCVLLCTGLWLWLAGIPWATSQARLGHASLLSRMPTLPSIENTR